MNQNNDDVIKKALSQVKTALLSIGVPCSHYRADKKPDQYIVWKEDYFGKTVSADDERRLQAIQGTAHYFTRTEYDPNVERIRQAFDNAEICWRYNSVQYESDTKYIHHEWVWEVTVL